MATAQEVLKKYEKVSDLFVPVFSELVVLFEHYGGTLSRHVSRPNFYALELPGKTLVGNREAIWDWYLGHREALEAMKPKVPF